MSEKHGNSPFAKVHGHKAEHLENASLESGHGTAVGGAQGAMIRPARSFTVEEEKKLYRKIDMHLLPMLAILYLLSFMDRGNIGNARLAGLEADLNMTGNDYAISLSAFFATYCIFEVPANLVLKKVRPSLWLGGITIVWGIVMTLMGVVQNFAGLVAARLALGIAEAGLFPGVILYLTMWYPRHLCQQRIAIFFSAATVAGAFSGLLAYGIGFMAGIGGYNGWRWIFILEGLLTVVAGIVALWALTDFPSTAKWLTEDEAAWVLYRKASDGSSVGEAEGVSTKYIKQAFADWKAWLSLGYYMGVVTPLYSVGLFMPTLINSFSTYTRPQVQLLTVPVYVFACIYVLIVAVLADRMRKRFIFVFMSLILCLVGLIINICPLPSGVKYFGLFLMAAGAYGGLPTVVTWLTNNTAGQTKRGVASAFQIGIGNLAALVPSNVYRTRDAPRYVMGHGVVLGFVVLGLVAAPLNAMLLKRENMKRDKWQAEQDKLPDSEKTTFTVQELRDQGDNAKEFRYTI